MVNVAMIGAGAISGIYMQNLVDVFEEVRLVGVCGRTREKVEAAQQKYGFSQIYNTVDDVLADPAVDIVLNLTRPGDHYRITRAALEAGKHVYTEKPLAATLEEGRELAVLAEAKGLMLCGAPDTFLGAGIQTCRKMVEDGWIGEPIGATAFMMSRGCEHRIPDPAFHFQHGDGPMMDMGPYYVTAMINLLGRVNGVMGVAKTTFPQRIITSQPKRGTVINVEVPTHVTGILDFASGATGTLLTTVDVHYDTQARFEIYGTLGTLVVPDPNTFGGPIRLLRPEGGTWREMPLLFDYGENSRGLGIAEMAKALETGRPARAGAQQLLHVLEILTAFAKSSNEKQYISMETDFAQKPPMGHYAMHGVLD